MAAPSGIEEQPIQSTPSQTGPPKKRIATRTLIGVAVTFLIVILLLGTAISQALININGGKYTVTYSWTYKGSNWTLTENIPTATYDSYRDHLKTYDFVSYVTVTDSLIHIIAEKLKSDANKSGYNMAQFILSFVQNVPYDIDQNTSGTINYPRYPVETLVDGIGDCKDHSTLYVSLMESVGVNMALLLLVPFSGDRHLAAGIGTEEFVDHSPSTSFQYDGTNYYYCETTYPGWMIGDMPPIFESYSVQVLPI